VIKFLAVKTGTKTLRYWSFLVREKNQNKYKEKAAWPSPRSTNGAAARSLRPFSPR
jgi:hypothetical protein